MLYIEPHAGSRPIVRLLHEASRQVGIEAYQISDPTVLGAIRQIIRRGVTVHIVLAPRIHHKSFTWIQQEFTRLVGAGAEVRWASHHYDHRFAIDHASFIVDDRGRGGGLVSTEGFTWRAYHVDRSYLWIGRDPKINQALEQVFLADWNHHHAGRWPRHTLVLSPGGETALLKVIDQPGPIVLETCKFGYVPHILNALERKGRLARVIVPSTLSAYDRTNLIGLMRHGVRVRFLPHPPLHANLIAGQALAYLGSLDMRWTSMYHNREVGIILKSTATRMLRAQFNRDWQRAQTR